MGSVVTNVALDVMTHSRITVHLGREAIGLIERPEAVAADLWNEGIRHWPTCLCSGRTGDEACSLSEVRQSICGAHRPTHKSGPSGRVACLPPHFSGLFPDAGNLIRDLLNGIAGTFQCIRPSEGFVVA
jgi:hypothetical protein